MLAVRSVTVLLLMACLLVWRPEAGVLAAPAYSAPLSGVIDFGLDYNDRGKEIKVMHPRRTFGPGDTIAYVAHLSAAPHSKTLHWTIAQVASSGHETVVLDDNAYPVRHPKTTNALYNRFTISALRKAGVKGPGTFVMRFRKGAVTLAQGMFRLSR